MPDPGLRERSKARRRTAITEVALTLFAERGYEQTTVADIAAASDVAPRTVALYFPTKQDIALGSFGDAADRLTAALAARPDDMSALDVVAHWLVAEEKTPDGECDRALYTRMFAANPEMAALRTARMGAASAAFSRAVARDLALPILSPEVQACAAAVGAVVMYIATLDEGAGRDAALAAALRFLRGGFSALQAARD